MKYTKAETVRKMVDSRLDQAEQCGADISDITIENFNTLLDEQFKDGGQVRCEEFTDLAWPYSLQFGALESAAMENAQWACIEASIKEIQRSLKKRIPR